MSKVKVGDIVECVVTGVQTYGAFVLIDNCINGLIHISEISKGYVRNIEDFVRVGDTLFVKVIELDEENLRAKVSLKEIREVNKRERYTRLPRFKQKINLTKYSCGVLFERLNSQIEETYKLLEDRVMLKVDLSHTGIENELKDKFFADFFDLVYNKNYTWEFDNKIKVEPRNKRENGGDCSSWK